MCNKRDENGTKRKCRSKSKFIITEILPTCGQSLMAAFWSLKVLEHYSKVPLPTEDIRKLLIKINVDWCRLNALTMKEPFSVSQVGRNEANIKRENSY